MELTNKKTYLYLARRDRKGIKILIVFPQGKEEFPPTRVQDLRSLGLPNSLYEELNKLIYEDRMLWEPFMECAEDFTVLTKSLTKRGYGAIPMHCAPAINLMGRVDEKKSPLPTPKLTGRQTMLRKKI